MVTTELNRHLSLLGGRSLLQNTALSNLSCVITFKRSLIFVKQETTSIQHKRQSELGSAHVRSISNRRHNEILWYMNQHFSPSYS